MRTVCYSSCPIELICLAGSFRGKGKSRNNLSWAADRATFYDESPPLSFDKKTYNILNKRRCREQFPLPLFVAS